MLHMLRFALLICLITPVFAQETPPAEKKTGDEPGKPADEKIEDHDETPRANPVLVMKTSMGEIHLELFATEAPETVKNFIGLAHGTKEFTDAKTREKTKRPFFDGLIFHRVIKGFMIQGGCPLGTGTGSPGYRFKDEINADALGLDKLKAFTPGKGPHPWLLIRTQEQFQQIVIGAAAHKLGIKSNEEYKKRFKEVEAELAKMTLKSLYSTMGYKYDTTLKSSKPTKGMLAMANSGPNTNGSQFFINLGDPIHLTGKHTVFGKVVKGMDVVEKIGEVKVEPRSSKPLEDISIVSVRLLKDGDDDGGEHAGKDDDDDDGEHDGEDKDGHDDDDSER